MLLTNRYELHERLGQGGMGIVHRAVDQLTGNVVALKQVLIKPDDLEFNSRPSDSDPYVALVREFQTLASLRHPHIISVLDYGFSATRQPYFTMELLAQASELRTAAFNTGFPEKINLLLQVLRALVYLHRHGVIHRDLKPENVLVDQSGRVRVVDFGLAIERSQAEERAGTLAYMAPEVLRSNLVSQAADLYAVGVMAYELFAGKRPFEGRDLAAILTKQPDFTLLDVPPALIEIIQRLLAKQPKDRYPDAQSVIKILVEAVDHPLEAEDTAIRESFLQAARFVGRDADLQKLLDSLKSAIQQQGSTWLLSGESGVGKSRLMDEVRIRALVQGALVLRGQAVEGGGRPYEVWHEIVPLLALSSPLEDMEASLLQLIVPELSRLLKLELPPIPEMPKLIQQQRLALIILEMMRHQTQPIVLLLEDLHWAAESLELLKGIYTAASPMSLLIIGSYRHEERPKLPDELPGSNLLELQRFNSESVKHLSQYMLGEIGQHAALVDWLVRETEGNAFFLVEVVRALAEEAGHLSRIQPELLPQQVFTGGIQTLIQRRLSRIPAWGTALLNFAAVAGRQLDQALLDRAANLLPERTLDDWLIACIDAAVLEVQEKSWRFSHDKVRDGVLNALNISESQSLHQQVAEAIESAYPENAAYLPILAEHWYQAQVAPKTLEYSLKAAEQARLLGTAVDLLKFAERAKAYLTMEAVPADRVKVQLLLGYAQLEAGNTDAAISHLEIGIEQTQQLAGKPLLANLLLWRGRIKTRQGEHEAAQRDFETVLTLLTPDQLALKAETLIAQGEEWVSQGLYEEGQASYLEALQIYELLNDPIGIAETYQALGRAAFSRTRVDESIQYMQQALTRYEALGLHKSLMATLGSLGNAYNTRGQLEIAAPYYERSLTLARKFGNRRGICASLTNLGHVAARSGDDQKALALYEEALQIARDELRDNNIINVCLSSLGEVYARQGDVQRSLDYQMQALTRRRETGDRWGETFSLGALGDLAVYQKDYPQALAYYRETEEKAQALEIDTFVFNSQILICNTHFLAGNLPEARIMLLALLKNETITQEPSLQGELLNVISFDTLRRDRPVLAAEYLALALQVNPSVRVTPFFAIAQQQLRLALGAQTFEKAMQDGVMLNLNEVFKAAQEVLSTGA